MLNYEMINLKEYKLNKIEDIQKQIFLDNALEGLYTIKELLFNFEMKKKYWLEKEKLKRKVYFRIDEKYLKKQKVTSVQDIFSKCSDLEIDYLILPLEYDYKSLTMEAYSILAQKINCVLASDLIAYTEVLLENINQNCSELSYLIQSLRGEVEICLNIDAFEYESLTDLAMQLQKFDLIKYIKIIKTKKYSVGCKGKEGEEFDDFLKMINCHKEIRILR